MNLESIKSFTLTFLVGISFLLTFGLWSYQSDNNLDSGQSLRNSIEIGGEELTKQDLIEPSSIIFHIGSQQHYGFANPNNQHNLFKDLQSWTFYDFQLSNETGKIKQEPQVEIEFPDAIPMQAAASLFTFNKVDSVALPDWSFNRIIITFNQSKSVLNVHFISESGQQRATATVNNSSKYNALWEKMIDKDGLNKLIMFDKDRKPIYVPAQEITMVKRKITVSMIEPTKLIRVLFPNPSGVSKLSNGDYSDAVRGMRVKYDGRKIEYFNPIDSGYEQINAEDLLEHSINKINDHKGWTDKYRLVTINPLENKIRYRMYYDGYPTFSDTDLTIIEQQWRNTDLVNYRRSLIRLGRILDGSEVTLSSGSEVIDLLDKYENGKKNDSEKVQDIQIGYQYNYESEISNVITLEPAWFVKINDHWQNVEELLPKKGGAQDAMESY